ncbi:MAG: acetyl-CoA carboxylase biotin carboxylase subunit [Alphaproteobacteria bacterium]|nr:acetyl-CoA carboxylase biotin carboxylase subunit [Alphaproteobacteria bacterium]
MYNKILVANRGEIACRIIQTIQRMGIQAVAVYSEADEDALHVEMADEAYFIGPPPPRESYLNIPALLKIAEQSRSDAIHPGYGFLSENAAFAELVHQKGFVFIGPPSRAIATMGDKLASKKIAQLCGIPCIPGTEEPIQDIQQAQKVAQEMGYPLLVKAAAGGGGKGMRVVREPHQLEESLKGAIHESMVGFGDERVFLEKYILSPRHIEIQIIADKHGNFIHLGERECSLQRRHQKVIEEAPSTIMTASLREEMGSQAIQLAKAVDYSSVGTIEFVVDTNLNYYFLEMNTRLQVEHPVTECITGLDLVEEMIRIAAGEPLRMSQEDIKFRGHAIEARIYAEDPTRGFLPSTGRIREYIPPHKKEQEVRLDTGIHEGDTISPYYDPLIAKLIVHQPNRNIACSALLEALDHYYIRGIATNIYFQASLVNSSFFKEGNFSTVTVDEFYEEGFTPQPPKNPMIAIGTAAVMHIIRKGSPETELTVLIGREAHSVTLCYENDRFEIKKDEKTLIIETLWKSGNPLFEGTFNGHNITLQIDAMGCFDTLFWNGYRATTRVVNSRVAELFMRMPLKQKESKSHIVSAPMPGLVIELPVKMGEPIKSGQPVAIIEAMKMENIIRANKDGIIERIYVKKGESVNLDQHIARIG